MKQLILSLILISTFQISKAQKDQDSKLELPTKDNVIFFEGVVNVDPAMTKKELYTKAREWFVNYYKSANDVLQMDDKEEGLLIGKGLHKYSFLNGLNTSEVSLFFTVNIAVKDGKYRYQIYNFNGKNKNQSALDAMATNPSGPNTTDVDFDNEYKVLISDGSRKKYRTKLLSGLKSEVLAIVLSLEKAMKSKASSEF